VAKAARGAGITPNDVIKGSRIHTAPTRVLQSLGRTAPTVRLRFAFYWMQHRTNPHGMPEICGLSKCDGGAALQSFKTQYSMSIAQALLHLALPIHHRYEFNLGNAGHTLVTTLYKADPISPVVVPCLVQSCIVRVKVTRHVYFFECDVPNGRVNKSL
jgi:hypothetical protein